MRDFPNEKAVEEYVKKTGQKLIIFEGTVYDVTTYLDQHPGGGDLIRELLGKSIDEAFEDNGHSASARKVFRDLEKLGCISGNEHDTDKSKVNMKGMDGFKIESKLKLDFSKGLYGQLLAANLQWDDYLQFINEPKHLINPIRDVRLFDNPILEMFTMTSWWMIPLGWSGPFFYFLSQSNLSLLMTIGCFLIGVLIWTFGEYLLHRFLFHAEDYWLPNHPKVLAHHFMLHGIHHAFPMDRYRLVFPVVPGYLIMYLVFISPLQSTLPEVYQGAVIAGLIFMYVLYDLIHYFLHHSTPSAYYWRDLKKYHMQHHYKNGLSGFGVSSKLWDYVFQTQITY